MIWRLIAWLVFTLVQRRVVLAGDADRERAASSLREHYAGGYLTLEEFSRRTGLVVSGAYIVFSLALVLGLTVLLHGISTPAFLAIAVVWLVPTYLFARFRRRNVRL